MRAFSSMIAVAILALSGCASSPSLPPPSKLINDYVDSTTVAHDAFRGSTAADRRAEFAAEGPPQEVVGDMFSAGPCDPTPGDSPTCPPPGAVVDAAQRPGAILYVRRVLVEHHDGQLDLSWVYLVVTGDRSELFDSSGRGYPGGLDDFRAHNSLFTVDDLLLIPDPLTSPTGAFRLRVVTGHTPPGHVWLYVLLGAAGLVVVAVAVGVVRRFREGPLFPDAPDLG